MKFGSQWVTNNENETWALAAEITCRLPGSAVVALNGTLGAGKSVWVRGMAQAIGIDPETVTSPTFTLWQTYHSPVADLQNRLNSQTGPARTLHHLDAYRLNSVEEFYDLGAEELFEQPGLIVIEWAERIVTALPDPHLQIRLEVVGETQRQITATAIGDFPWL